MECMQSTGRVVSFRRRKPPATSYLEFQIPVNFVSKGANLSPSTAGYRRGSE